MIDTTAPGIAVPTALEERRAGITDRGRAVLAAYALADALRAMERAAAPGVLKVLLRP